MIVVDASVVIDVLVGEARAIQRLETQDLVAPHLLDAEVGNVLRRKACTGELDAEIAEAGLGDYLEIEIIRFGHVGLLTRAWELRNNLTVYDALYVALAEALEIPLLTLDARIASARGLRAHVEVVPV